MRLNFNQDMFIETLILLKFIYCQLLKSYTADIFVSVKTPDLR